MVWEVMASGEYKDLHDFNGTVTNANGQSGADGMLPYGIVAFDNAGDLCGTASQGGPNLVSGGVYAGSVWKIATVAAPAAPTGLLAVVIGRSIRLTWNAITGVTSYNVYLGRTPGGESSRPIAVVTGPGFTMPAGLRSNTTYYFEVTATNAIGESPRSAEVSDRAHFFYRPLTER